MSFRFPDILSLVARLVLLGVLGGCVAPGGGTGVSLATLDPVVPEAVPQEPVAGVSGAEFGAFPPWQLGSYWEYSDGYTLQVTETDGQSATLERMDQPGDWVKRDGFFKVDSLNGGVRRQVIYRSPNPAMLFPLAVGKSVLFDREYLIDKKLYVHQTSWRVVGREIITVPAGTFDCWVLIWNSRSQKSNWTGYEKWWYNPDVGNYVRMEYRYGKAPNSSRVLVKYRNGA